MITIKKASFNENEKRPLFVALQAAVNEFINHYCDPKSHCQTCEYRHVCYDLVKARDFAYRMTQEGEKK